MASPADKTALRREAGELRQALSLAVSDARARIARNFLANVPLAAGSTLASYIPAHNEADPGLIAERLRGAGYPIALPRVAAKNAPLQFRLWPPETPPVKGAFDLFEAAPDWPYAKPNVVLVPLLAFDAEGFRLGYGGGYYDRTLRALRDSGTVLAVGIGYAGQERDLPHDPHDEKLDWVVTEKDAVRIES